MASEKRLTVGGALALGVGTLTAALFGHAHSVCNSGLGVLAQGVSSSAARTCARYDLVFYLGVGAVVVGAVLLIAGLTSRNRVAPPPVDEAQETAPTVSPAVEGKSRKVWLWAIAPVVLLIIVGAVVSGGKASTASTAVQAPTVTSGNTGSGDLGTGDTGTGNAGNTGGTGTGNTGSGNSASTTTVPLIPTPNLVGMSIAAVSEDPNDGVTYLVTGAPNETCDGGATDYVVSQSPAAGTMETAPVPVALTGSCPS